MRLMMHIGRRVFSILLLIGMLISLIPLKNAVRAEDASAKDDILVTNVQITNQLGETIADQGEIATDELLTLDLSWEMAQSKLIEEGESFVIPLPQALNYLEANGSLPDGMGNYQLSGNQLQLTFTQNYQMEPDDRLPDYGSVKQYQGTLKLQAQAIETEEKTLALDFGNQILQQVTIKSETKNKEQIPIEEGNQSNENRTDLNDPHDLNERNVWVIRSMKVLNEAGEPFTEEQPPTRNDNIQIDFTWALKDDVDIADGDYYTYQLPNYFAVHNALIDEELENSTPGGESLGTFDLSTTGLLTIKFNGKSSGLSNREGTIELFTQLDISEEIIQIVTEEEINEDGSTSGKVEVSVAKAKITKVGTIDTENNNNVINWEIIINENSLKLANVKVTDALGHGQRFLTTGCEIPDGKGGWVTAPAGFYQCIHNHENGDFVLNFPDLEKNNKKLDHPVKFIVRSKITDVTTVSSYSNSAVIEGTNFDFSRADASVDRVDIDNYKFLNDSQFEKGILDWRIKATIEHDGGTIVDQMYPNTSWPDGALHYLAEDTLVIEDALGNKIESGDWKFIPTEEVKKKGKIIRFGIKLKNAGTYYLSYQTKTFDVPPTIGKDITNYAWIEGVRYNGSQKIDDDNLLGVLKYHAGTDYTKREITWWTTINRNKIVMKNAEITDLYSRVDGINNKSALRLNAETLKIYPHNANGHIDESRELKLDEDFTLESKGQNYIDGFVIKLTGDYATTSETLEIRYNTHFNMENQKTSDNGLQSNYFVNSAIVRYKNDADEDGYDSHETEMWVDNLFGKNGWKYGAYVAKGEEYKNQKSPFEGEKPGENSVYWTVPLNIWGLKLPAGTVIKEDLQAGQTLGDIRIHKVDFAREDYTVILKNIGDQLQEDIDFKIIPNGEDSNDFGVELLKEIDEPFAIFIKAKASNDVFQYKNKVEMAVEGMDTLNLEALVEKSSQSAWLSKTGTQGIEGDQGAFQANWELVLNKDARTVKDPVITDTIVTNEQTFQQEDGKVKVKAYKAIKKNLGNFEKGEEVDLTKDGRSVDLENDMVNGTQTLKVSLGASIDGPYIIEYFTNIDPALRNGTQIRNAAKLLGLDQVISETTKTIEVKSTQGSGTSTGVDGSIAIRKVDKDKNLIDKPATFDIFRVDASGELLQFLPKVVVKGDRIIQVGEKPVDLEKITGLRYGKYAIQEITPPDGYKLDETAYKFELGTGEGATKDYVYEAINEIKPFDLSILKLSKIDESKLIGAKFTLYPENSEQELATAMTDDQGSGKFVKADGTPYELEVGKNYKVKETEAPKGFVKLKSEFIISISQNGEVKVSYEGADLETEDLSVTQGQGAANSQIQFTARNDARMPLPKTGGDGLAATITLGLAAILIALWYHFSIKKRRDWHEESR